MKIIILGSEGFIGKHLINFYLSLGYSVSGADILQTNTLNYTYFKISRLSPETDELFKNKFDICINAAGSGDVSYSMLHPVNDFESNSLDVIRFLDAIRRNCPICKYIHISSAAVYGNPTKLPIKETDSLSPLSPYGWNKQISELICKQYHTVYGIETAIVRPFSVYGPGLKKQIFWDVYQKYLTNPKVIELGGTGSETRDFIFIDDVVKAIHIIVNHGLKTGEIYNIASGTENLIKTVIHGLFENFLKKPEIIFNNLTRPGNPINWQADITKIQNLGFEINYDMSKGLKKLSKWMLSLN